ncbi:MAG: helix-turn-helix domain-containing protein [Desulfobacterales bacterium]|nr:helix-turn-helix domain-containing protein [Desulfobacterales bacterium]
MASRKPLPPEVPVLLTREQVAEILCYSKDTVDRRIRAGKLKAVKDGRLVRVSSADLNAYIRASKRWR